MGEDSAIYVPITALCVLYHLSGNFVSYILLLFFFSQGRVDIIETQADVKQKEKRKRIIAHGPV